MTLRKMKVLIVGLACAAIPLATTVSCDPVHGFNFFRDSHHDEGFVDVFFEEVLFYDDCFFDDCFFDEIVIYD